MIRLTLFDTESHPLCTACGENCASLFALRAYQSGDYLLLESDTPYVYLNVDEHYSSAHLYLPTGRFIYRFPTETDALRPYPRMAFRGDAHRYMASADMGIEKVYRNLAVNPLCQHEMEQGYPFVHANVETRGESNFFARNVIDGVTLNNRHGSWPYQSWGIGMSEQAQITLDFGRPVRTDHMVLVLRADFPHDAYWKQASVTLSDGFEKTFPLEQTAAGQPVSFDGEHVITSLTLHSLIKQVMDSPFPALTEWEVWGQG